MKMMSNKTLLKKTNSFPLKNKSLNSMYQRQSSAVGSSAEVPKVGDEIFHEAHPQHAISQTQLRNLFTCAACKEYGAGDRFACNGCDFQLHDFCALAPPALKRHPFHPYHNVIYFPKPVKGGILKSRCCICAKPNKGCVFKCTVCSFQMHPCCAMLSTQINIPVHPHTVKLLPMPCLSLNGDPAGVVCGECNRSRSGRVYHCTICDYHLHAVCAKNMVNGLQANGIQGTDKPNMLRTAAKFASQVVIELVGVLIEGLGENVGQALMQTATRGS